MNGHYKTRRSTRRTRRARRSRAVLLGVLALALVIGAAVLLRHRSSGGDWQLRLVNPETPMPDGYAPPALTDVGDGQSVDSRCADALLQMLDDCRAAGLSPLVCSSYRSQETQQSLFDNKIQRVMAEQGCSEDAAEQIAATVVAVPGTSEHQLGLAVDLVDAGYQILDDAQEQTAVQQWLMAHSWEYGFILRYPTDKSDVTGIIYEPWHYRYVGKENAKAIYESGLCLEEYLAQH